MTRRAAMAALADPRLVNYVERIHEALPSTLMKAEAMGECASAAEVWWKGKRAEDAVDGSR